MIRVWTERQAAYFEIEGDKVEFVNRGDNSYWVIFRGDKPVAFFMAAQVVAIRYYENKLV